MALLSLPAYPGIFLSENPNLSSSPVISLFSRTYYLGSSTLGDAYTNVPTPIGSQNDFTNLFGSSSAINLSNITAYLANTARGLYFVRVMPAPVGTVTVTSAIAGVYTVTVGGYDTVVTVPASPTPTLTIVIQALILALNNNTSVNQLIEADTLTDNLGAPIYTGAFRIRSKNGNLFTLAQTGANLTVTAVTTPSVLNFWDYLSAIDRLTQTEVESPLGFILCPEAFYTLPNLSDRTVVGNKLENAARSLRWFAMIDPGQPTIVNHPLLAKLDFAGMNAIQGHSAVYYPYLTDNTGNDVSPSPMVAAYALQSYEILGIDKPPAGSDYPFMGIAGVRYTLSNAQKGDLAQSRINVIIKKSGVGIVPYDTLTRAIDPKYSMISARVILNSIERSIYESIDISGAMFSSNRSKGLFYVKLRSVIENVLAIYYSNGALYGATPEQAYAVRCDQTIQNPADLQAGIVTALIYIVPALTARQLSIVVYPIQIGGIQSALAIS